MSEARPILPGRACLRVVNPVWSMQERCKDLIPRVVPMVQALPEHRGQTMSQAYICMETYECTGGVVFAKTNLDARKVAASEWNDGELGGLSVRRAPDLDKYSDTGMVPAWELICKHGWRWEDGCCNCGHSLDLDDLEDEGKDPTNVVGFYGGMVFCDGLCHAEYGARKSAEEAAGQAFLDAMIDRVRQRFGPVNISRTHHYTKMWRGLFTTEQASVYFDFPGQKFGPACLHYQDRFVAGRTKHMPLDLFLTCCGGDKELFEEWARAHKEGERA